jgi:hypothetical protein
MIRFFARLVSMRRKIVNSMVLRHPPPGDVVEKEFDLYDYEQCRGERSDAWAR